MEAKVMEILLFVPSPSTTENLGSSVLGPTVVEMACLSENPLSLPTSGTDNNMQTEMTSQRLSSLTLQTVSERQTDRTSGSFVSCITLVQPTLDQLCVKKKRPCSATFATSNCTLTASAELQNCPSLATSDLNLTTSNTSMGHHLLHKRAKVMRSNQQHNTPMFNKNTGLPLCSSPVPQRKSAIFNFENSVKTTNLIRRIILEKESENDENFKNQVVKKTTNLSPVTNSLLGSFEESVLNGRLQPVNIIHNGFRAEIGTSGLISGRLYCPDHLKMPVTVFFYNVHENEQHFASPYLAKVGLGKKGYQVPRKGTVQVTLFNPQDNVVKMFVVTYDLSEMPNNSQSFVRQRTLFLPKLMNAEKAGAAYLRYLVHLRFISSKSGRLYLHRDIRMLVFRRNEYDPHLLQGGPASFHWHTITQQPSNPSFSSRC